MIKTIVTIPNWAAPTQEISDAFFTAVQNFANQGKYTNQVSSNVSEDGTKVVERWDWADTATAQEYLDLSTSTFGAYYTSGTTGQIVTA